MCWKEAHQAAFLKEISRISKSGQSLLLVHGGGKEITKALETAGIPTRFVSGRRYTDEATMAVVDQVLAKINGRIVEILKSEGTSAKGFSGKWNQLMLAKPLTDLGRVGEPQDVREKILKQALGESKLPVFYSVAVDSDGKPLNINADDFAMALAIQCRAKRLIFLTDTGAILSKAGEPIHLITAKDVDALITDGTITGGMAVKARACLEAVQKGVGRVDICKTIQGLGTDRDESLTGTGFVV